MIPRGGYVFAGVERLFQSDAHAALEQNGSVFLLPDRREPLEVLGIACANLQTDSRGIP